MNEKKEALIIERKDSPVRFRNDGFCTRLKNSLAGVFTRRKLAKTKLVKPFGGETESTLFRASNKLDNKKYSWYSFVPKFLFSEFIQFANLYYLLLSVSQFFPKYEVGFKISYILPLAVILVSRLIEETISTVQTFLRDSATNNEKFAALDQNLKKTEKLSGDIVVGDVLLLTSGRIPCDCAILKSKYAKKQGLRLREDRPDRRRDRPQAPQAPRAVPAVAG